MNDYKEVTLTLPKSVELRNGGARGWRSWEHGDSDPFREFRDQQVKKVPKVHLVPARESVLRESRIVAGKKSLVDLMESPTEKTRTEAPTEIEFLEWVKDKGGIVVGDWPAENQRRPEAWIVMPTDGPSGSRIKAAGVVSMFIKHVIWKFHPYVDFNSVASYSCVINLSNGIKALVTEGNWDVLNKIETKGAPYKPAKSKAKTVEVKGVEVFVLKQ